MEFALDRRPADDSYSCQSKEVGSVRSQSAPMPSGSYHPVLRAWTSGSHRSGDVNPAPSRAMRLSARRRHRLGIVDDEQALFSCPCTYVARRHLLALQGGHVHVTNKHVIFAPNRLATMLGRDTWAIPIGNISSVKTSTVEVSWWPSSLPAVILHLAPSADPPARILAAPQAQQASDIAAAIGDIRGQPVDRES
jgi:hypothetical protein